jgi:hypothetical protein
MGHVRLGVLPKSREWTHVVELLTKGPAVPVLAAAVATAAEDELSSARGDPVLGNTVWLLAQLTLAARTDRFAPELTALGFAPGSEQSLLNIVAGFSSAIDSQIVGTSGRTDLGALARQAAAETLTTLVGDQMPGLFGTTADDVRIELGKFATKDRFAKLARDFFARLTNKTLDYYLSRVLADHVGPDRALATLADQSRFRIALNIHCREASVIIEQFAGSWFSKANYQGRLTREAAQGFSDYALKKMRDELRKRRADIA